MSDRDADSRRAGLRQWLAEFDSLSGAELQPASGDASFRGYFRIEKDAETYIVMDAPPPNEDCRPFVTIAGYLEAMGLHCPAILGADFDRGFVLMTDLGNTQYLAAMKHDPACADRLYADALAALHKLQENGVAYQQKLPDYDDEFVAFELSIFRDWLCKRHLAIDFTTSEEQKWHECCELLIANARDQKRVFMHRDYHSRNLMVTEHDNPGILDFQDAVEGPFTYDLVSLLKDCYVQWPRHQVHDLAYSFYENCDVAIRQRVDEKQFMRYFDLMGVQRHLKAAGIFARLNDRDGKPAYMSDVPRTLGYIVELDDDYAELAFLTDLIRNRVLPALPGSQ